MGIPLTKFNFCVAKKYFSCCNIKYFMCENNFHVQKINFIFFVIFEKVKNIFARPLRGSCAKNARSVHLTPIFGVGGLENPRI